MRLSFCAVSRYKTATHAGCISETNVQLPCATPPSSGEMPDVAATMPIDLMTSQLLVQECSVMMD